MSKVDGNLIFKETPDASYTIYGELFNAMSRDIRDFNDYLLGLNQVWDNPNIYNPGSSGWKQADHMPVPENLKAKRKLSDGSAPAPWAPHDGQTRVLDSDMNQIVTGLKTVTAKARTLKMGFNYNDGAVHTVSKGDRITVQMTVDIAAVLKQIQDTLNAYAGYWDTHDTCARSCQISCQVGCQVMCQACVASNCHDQHCGGCT